MITNDCGITILNSTTRLYDMVICDSLGKWTPSYEEEVAGLAMTLEMRRGHYCAQLLTGVARRKNEKLKLSNPSVVFYPGLLGDGSDGKFIFTTEEVGSCSGNAA